MIYQKIGKEMIKQNYDILGIGNAVTDILVEVDYSFLKKNELEEGAMQLVDEAVINNLLSDLSISKTLAGGSVANTLATISNLGGNCAFIGSRKNDKFGKLFSKSMNENNIYLSNQENENGKSSSLCLVLITPNGERTMCTYLGASTNLSNEDMDISLLKKSKIIYLEGYLFDLPEAKNIFYAVVNNAAKYDYEVALSLSDPFCVDRHRKDFIKLINKKINILFANKSEMEALYKCDIKNALLESSKNVKISISTLGEKGSILYYDNKILEAEAYPVNVIDTTGAGDNFAAGFLYSYINQVSFENCMKAGALCASETIKTIGARPQSNLKELLTKNSILEN